MIIKPIELKQANEFVAKHHRHHKPVRFHRFSLSLWDNNKLVGVAIVGKPVARLVDQSTTLEVSRLCTNGKKNACSMLYSAAARVGKELGYKKIQTYILESEFGSSLKASNWINEGVAGGGQWKHTDGKPRRTDQPTEKKQRWAKYL